MANPATHRFHPLAYVVKLNIEMSMADLIVKVCNSTSKLEEPTPIPTNILAHFPFHRMHSAEEDNYADRDFIVLDRIDSIKSFKTAKSKNLETFESITELGEGQLAVKMKREVHMFVENRDSNNSQPKSSASSKTAQWDKGGPGESSEESDEGGVDGEVRVLDKEEYGVGRPGLENGMGVTTTVSAQR